MKLQGLGNYIMWNYKVKVILLQERVWKHVEVAEDADFGNTSADSTIGVTMTTHQHIFNSIEHMYRAGQIIISTWTKFKMHF